MNEEEIWEKIQFEIEHQLYDLLPMSSEENDDEDTANCRADMAVRNIKNLLEKEGYELKKKE